jgi:cytidine deaminase
MRSGRRFDRGRATVAIDWPALRAAAQTAARSAYAPYSRLQVGAAGQVQGDSAGGTEGGMGAGGRARIVVGCNVENASYGLTLCAECGLVSALHASGGGRLVAVSVVAGDGAPLVPCGRCRQLLLEAGGPGLLLDAEDGPREIGSLLPSAFTGSDLAARRDAGA